VQSNSSKGEVPVQTVELAGPHLLEVFLAVVLTHESEGRINYLGLRFQVLVQLFLVTEVSEAGALSIELS